VTLTGVGGIGKTRLAIGAAAETVDAFADGVAFVALSTVMSHDNLLRAVATALHVREQPGEELIETLGGNLRRRELLLVLDNFEQIVTAAGLLAQLLERVPRLKVLVTSRVRLNVVAEHVVRVQPLAAPPASADGDATLDYPAAQLLAQRVRASDRDRIFGDEALAQLGEIARRLDGIPLALELAAARLRVLGPAQLLARLDRRLEVLGEAPRDAEARQRTLAATLAWSVDLLPDDARRLFPALAVFPGGCSLEAVEAVAPDGIDPVSALETLLDASLVNRVDTFDEFRVTMYEPVREHAVASLRSSGGDRDARDRMLAYYAARMDGNAMLELGPGVDWSIVVAQEEANIRAAIEWGIESGAVDATVLVFLGAWQSWRSLAEVGRWVDILLDRTRGLTSAARFHVLRAAMTVAASRGAIETQTARAHEMLAIAETLDDVTVRVAGRLYVAWCLHATDPGPARAYVDEAIRLAEDVGGDLLIQALGNRCEEALAVGDDRLAADDAERMLEIADEMGASTARFVALTFLGWIALLAGRLDEARRLAEDANEQVARIFARGGYGGMRALSLLGHVHLHRGDDDLAAACLRTVVEARHERGMSTEVSFGLYALAATYARADAERAIVLAAAAGDVSLCYSMGGEYQREVPYLRDRLAVLRSFPAAERARLEARGRRMTRDEAVALALSPLRTANAAATRSREATTA
jgi:predicted ATPase